jgi:hypothetical protein
VYDGRAIKLYIDGELAGSRSASARIVRPGVPLTVGQLGGGGGRFDGTIANVRISAGARTAEWIRTTYETFGTRRASAGRPNDVRASLGECAAVTGKSGDRP